eukprot:Seg1764.5 transcript_id=Seg1764.5/GoldUCD/mRNA.D3Y31 product="Forkhead box protein L1" protein_id=Seg1764.5/GoldUCD/D3Y31
MDSTCYSTGGILLRFPLVMAKAEAGKIKPPSSPIRPPLIRIEDLPKPSTETKSKEAPKNSSKFSIVSLLAKDTKMDDTSSDDSKTNASPPAKPSSKKDSSRRSEDRNLPSYTSMIGRAILSNHAQRVTLGEIYEYIEEKFPAIESKVKGWRNCVRHNLSLNECFVKVGPSMQGRGNNWTVHPSYVESFLRGQFRKRMVSKRKNSKLFGGVQWYGGPVNGVPFGEQPPVMFPCRMQTREAYADFQLDLRRKNVDFHTTGCEIGKTIDRPRMPFILPHEDAGNANGAKMCMHLGSPPEYNDFHFAKHFPAVPNLCRRSTFENDCGSSKTSSPISRLQNFYDMYPPHINQAVMTKSLVNRSSRTSDSFIERTEIFAQKQRSIYYHFPSNINSAEPKISELGCQQEKGCLLSMQKHETSGKRYIERDNFHVNGNNSFTSQSIL